MSLFLSIPEGWGYEAPDPSVGIFGETWWHDDCPAFPVSHPFEVYDNLPDVGPVIEKIASVNHGVDRISVWRYRLECPACRTVTEWEQCARDPEPEEDDR